MKSRGRDDIEYYLRRRILMKIKKQLALGLCFVMAAPMSALAGEISEEDSSTLPSSLRVSAR